MAKNSYMTEEKLRKSKADDAVPYKVMIALALMCAALFGLNALKEYYTTVEGINALFGQTHLIALAGLGVIVVSGVVLLALNKFKVVRVICPWILACGTLTALTGGAMTVSWIEDIDLMIFVCVAALVQYVVFQLYKWEFFLVSMPTVTAAVVFYGFKSGFTADVRGLFLLIVGLLLIVGSALYTFLAAKNKGNLKLGGRSRKILSPKAAPMLVYIVSALWVVCTVAVVVLSYVTGLGGLFSYYCMFAAIAVEFIAAVYFTFQLN